MDVQTDSSGGLSAARRQSDESDMAMQADTCVVQGVVVSPADIDVQQQVVTATPIVRSRSERALHGARTAASSSTLPITLIRQHSYQAWTANQLKDVCEHVFTSLAYLLLFSLQFTLHLVPLIIILAVGGGVCAQPLEQWLMIVGFSGLLAHAIILALALCMNDNSGELCCLLLMGVCVIAWTVCIYLLVEKSFDCLPFDVAELNSLDANRTLFYEPLMPDATLASTRAHAHAHCKPNVTAAVNQTVPCTYVLSACEPHLWRAARGLSVFWIVVDGTISVIFGGGCFLMGAAS